VTSTDGWRRAAAMRAGSRSELSRLEAHRMRRVSDAILVGANTVRLDESALTTRLPTARGHDPKARDPRRRLTCRRTRSVCRARSLAATGDADQARARRLESAAPRCCAWRARHGRSICGALLDELGRREILTLLVEGGGQCTGRCSPPGSPTEVGAFYAPKLIGAGGVPLLPSTGDQDGRRLAPRRAFRRAGSPMISSSSETC